MADIFRHLVNKRRGTEKDTGREECGLCLSEEKTKIVNALCLVRRGWILSIVHCLFLTSFMPLGQRSLGLCVSGCALPHLHTPIVRLVRLNITVVLKKYLVFSYIPGFVPLHSLYQGWTFQVYFITLYL